MPWTCAMTSRTDTIMPAGGDAGTWPAIAGDWAVLHPLARRDPDQSG